MLTIEQFQNLQMAQLQTKQNYTDVMRYFNGLVRFLFAKEGSWTLPRRLWQRNFVCQFPCGSISATVSREELYPYIQKTQSNICQISILQNGQEVWSGEWNGYEKTIYDIIIKHLLTMRAPYKGQGDPWTKVCSSLDWTAASLDFLGGRAGITGEFAYRTVCLHILSGILYRATGMNTVDFANRYLQRE